ncbi:MAG: heavy-metal-associated domain-containing protein, partial [Ruminococcus sp.]|nr:heavy-metal-associated domain-containing protein [Ruminococcus sp.]
DDFKNNSISSENNTVTIKIKGMMCGHCESHVKEALENIDGVTVTEISHEQGRAVIELSCTVDNKAMKKAVEDAGYKVIKFE